MTRRHLLTRAVLVAVASWALWIASADARLALGFGAVMLALVAGGGYTPTFAAMEPDTTAKGTTEATPFAPQTHGSGSRRWPPRKETPDNVHDQRTTR